MILSHRWYPSLTPVDSDSAEFANVVKYLYAWSNAQNIELRAEKMADTDALAPHILVFTPSVLQLLSIAPADLIVPATVDAVFSFYYPEISLLDVLRKWGLPLISHPYVRSAPLPPAPPPPPPVPVDDVVGIPDAQHPGLFTGATYWDFVAGRIYRAAGGRRFFAVMIGTPPMALFLWSEIQG